MLSITIPMSSILITRFLLNVREAADITTTDSNGTPSFVRSRNIARARDNLDPQTIIFAGPELTANTEISLQVAQSFPDPEGGPDRIGEWGDMDEDDEDWEGAEDDGDEVETQMTCVSTVRDDPESHL